MALQCTGSSEPLPLPQKRLWRAWDVSLRTPSAVIFTTFVWCYESWSPPLQSFGFSRQRHENTLSDVACFKRQIKLWTVFCLESAHHEVNVQAQNGNGMPRELSMNQGYGYVQSHMHAIQGHQWESSKNIFFSPIKYDPVSPKSLIVGAVCNGKAARSLIDDSEPFMSACSSGSWCVNILLHQFRWHSARSKGVFVRMLSRSKSHTDLDTEIHTDILSQLLLLDTRQNIL